MADITEFETSEETKSENTVVIPAHKEYPNQRVDPKDPLVEGDKVEVVYRKNGVDEIVLSYIQDTPIEHGKEVRVFFGWAINDDVAFTAPMERHRVISNSGTVIEKIKSAQAIEE